MLYLLLAVGDEDLFKCSQGGSLTLTLCSKLLINILDPVIFSLASVALSNRLPIPECTVTVSISSRILKVQRQCTSYCISFLLLAIELTTGERS